MHQGRTRACPECKCKCKHKRRRRVNEHEPGQGPGHIDDQHVSENERENTSRLGLTRSHCLTCGCGNGKWKEARDGRRRGEGVKGRAGGVVGFFFIVPVGIHGRGQCGDSENVEVNENEARERGPEPRGDGGRWERQEEVVGGVWCMCVCVPRLSGTRHRGRSPTFLLPFPPAKKIPPSCPPPPKNVTYQTLLRLIYISPRPGPACRAVHACVRACVPWISRLRALVLPFPFLFSQCSFRPVTRLSLVGWKTAGSKAEKERGSAETHILYTYTHTQAHPERVKG